MTSGLPDRVLEGALAWIDRHLAYFDPYRDGELSGLCEIPLAELALLALSTARCSAPADEGATDRRLEFLETAYHAATYRERPFREPETLVSHLMVGVALEYAGRLDLSSQCSHLARLVDASTLTAPSLPPHRLMELRHALDLARVRHRLPSYAELFRATLPSHAVNPIFMSDTEAYVLTHVLFYASDLGHRPPAGIDRPDIARLATLVDRLLGMYIVAGNWDLTAELILSARCLRTSSSFADFGWQCIAGAQHADGAVPGPRWRPDAQTDADLATLYHTTLVTALAALAVSDSRTA